MRIALDYGRDEIDKIVREVGNTWWDQAREMVPPLLTSAVKTTAAAVQVDSGYIWWRLLNDQRSWESIPKSEMLDVAVRLTLMSVTRSHDPDVQFEMPTLEGEKQVDRGMTALVRWADTAFAERAVDLLLETIGEVSQRIQRATANITGERISEKQALLVVLVDLPLRVRDHPFWFRDPLSVGAVMRRIMRKG